MARKGRKSNRDQQVEEDKILSEDRAENGNRVHNDDEELVEVVKVDPENEDELYGPEGETRLSFKIIDADNNEEKVMEEIDDFTEDDDVLQDFSERQRMINEGSEVLQEKLDQHNSLSPDLSGDDIDAAWEDSSVSGEESVGGSAPTPDQDVVDELGQALGIGYEDYEPLHTADKLEERDLDRWELNPASVEEIEEQEDELDELEENETARILEGDLDINVLVDEDLEEEDLDTEDKEEDEDDLLEDEDDYNEFELEDDDLDDYLDDLDDEDDD